MVDHVSALHVRSHQYGGRKPASERLDPAEAAVREVWEETGLIIEIEGLLDVIHGKEHPNGASIVIIYTGNVRSGKMEAGDDVDGVDFFDLDNLPPIAFEATQKALRHLRVE